jgi:hypothetical protein
MNYQNRVVLFLDILGFKNILDKTVDKDDIDDTIKIAHLYEALNYMNESINWRTTKETSREISQFSDSIVISFLATDKVEFGNLISDIFEIVTYLVSKGILCRGAISIGKLIHDKNTIFGPALVDAYLTESKAAMYPRIILDLSLIEILSNVQSNNNNDSDLNEFKSFLREDLDGKWYLDYIVTPIVAYGDVEYLKDFLPSLRKIITDGLKFKSPDIKVKYGWLRYKFNNAINDMKAKPAEYQITNPEAFDYLNKIKPIK